MGILGKYLYVDFLNKAVDGEKKTFAKIASVENSQVN